MEKVNKITWVADADYLTSHHCDYISAQEKAEILKRYEQKISLIVGAKVEGDLMFVAIFDLSKTSLHVREVGGNFGRFYRELDKFSLGLAAMCGYGEVTFCTKRRTIAEKWAKNAGYDKTPEYENHFEFSKRVK